MLQALVFGSFACHNNYAKNENREAKPKIQARILDNRNNSTLLYYLKNSDNKNYFVLRDPQVHHSGDTLYIESLYTNNNVGQIKVNQFNPPLLIKLSPDSLFKKQISYKELSSSSHYFVAIRIYNKNYPYSPQKDYVTYHSIKQFLSFEQKNSFLLTLKVK